MPEYRSSLKNKHMATELMVLLDSFMSIRGGRNVPRVEDLFSSLDSCQARKGGTSIRLGMVECPTPAITVDYEEATVDYSKN